MPNATPGHPSSSETPRSLLVAVVAFVLSSTLHFGAFEVVKDRIFTPLRLTEPPVKPVSADDTKPTTVDLYEEAGGVTADPMDKAGLLEEAPGMPADLMEQSVPASLFDPPPAPEAPPPDMALPDPPESKAAELPPPRELPVPDILAITDARAREMARPIERREIPDIDRHLLSPDLTLSFSTEQQPPEVDTASILARIPELLASSAGDPALGIRLAAPIPAAVERARVAEETIPDVGPVAEGTVVTDIAPEPVAQVAPAKPLDDRLAVSVSALRPANDPDHVYFRIDVAPRDPGALPDIPRDIVFVQDTSASLTSLRLNPCRAAIRTAISSLGPADRFNICAFSTTNLFLAPGGWLSPTPEAIEAANAFLATLDSRGNTDLFRSMHDILSLPRDPDRAPIAIILTDGHVTAGGISRDSAIIGTFSRLNAGTVSVFTVGVDKNANAFLLDMLSFCDRGGNTAITPSRFDIQKTIGSVVGSIGQPILANVRFNFDVASGADVFPVLTSNLYRDRPLRLYGRLPADRPSFAFQARGDANGDKYDMLFDIDLRDETVATGDAALPVEWAVQRMYDLVSRFASSEDPSLVLEMQRLGHQYGIPVPHPGRVGIAQ